LKPDRSPLENLAPLADGIQGPLLPDLRPAFLPPGAHFSGIGETIRVGDLLEFELLDVHDLHPAVFQNGRMRVEHRRAVLFEVFDDLVHPLIGRIANQLHGEGPDLPAQPDEFQMHRGLVAEVLVEALGQFQTAAGLEQGLEIGHRGVRLDGV